MDFGGNRPRLLQGQRPRLVPGGSTDWDPTKVSSSITGYSHEAVPHFPEVSCCLYDVYILLFLFLFNFFTTFLVLLEVS